MADKEWQRLWRRREERSPYENRVEFEVRILPYVRHSPHDIISHCLAELERQGLWSEAFAKKLEAVYLLAAGAPMQVHQVAEGRDDETRTQIRRGLRAVSYFVRGVERGLKSENFDLALFEKLFYETFQQHGSEITKWFCLNYGSILEANIDPQVYLDSLDQVIQVGGRSSASIFSAGYHELFHENVTPQDFAAAINRIRTATGSRWSALTYATQLRRVVYFQDDPQEFENYIISRTHQFGDRIAYKLVEAQFDYQRIPQGESEYGLAELEADVQSLIDKFDPKIASWYVEGVIKVRRTQRAVESNIQDLQQRIQEFEVRSDLDPEERQRLISDKARLDKQFITQHELTIENFRHSYAEILTKLGRQAAALYAFATIGWDNGWSFLGLDKVVDWYVGQVGKKFANRSLWLLSQITGGSPMKLKRDMRELAEIVRDKGEAEALNYLRYSYGAVKHGAYGEGLIIPRSKRKAGEEDEPPEEEESYIPTEEELAELFAAFDGEL